MKQEVSMMNPHSSAAPVASSVRSTPVHYLHVVGDVCPLCDQPIPHDRADEIAERLEAREREQFAAISNQLGEKFEAEKAAIKRESEAALKKAKAEAAENEAAIRAEAKRVADESAAAQLAVRLREQREALEAAKTEAVNAEKSASYKEKLKLSAKVEELQRALDKKTAEELGEGAEIDLFEDLKGAFHSDRIERVNKGLPGADILQTVIHNDRECGKIILDSKNHNAWRNDFVAKLRSDQMAAGAEHAILSTRKFPSGMYHLHVQDGNPDCQSGAGCRPCTNPSPASDPNAYVAYEQ